MKLRYLAMTAAAILAASCSPKAPSDPLEVSLCAAIAEKVGSDAAVSLEGFTRVDSVTFEQLLATRRKAFEVKLAQDTKYYEKYRAERMEANAKKHQDAMAKTKDILASFDKLEAGLAGRMDEIAYYDCAFSGQAKSSAGTVSLAGYNAVVTPAGDVMAIQAGTKGIHSGLGKLIPGYTELIKGEE